MADSTFYNNGVYSVITGAVNLGSDSFKAMLTSSAYVPSQTHAFRSDVTNEITGSGYTAGGVPISGLTITAAGSETRWDFNDPAWYGATFTARFMVIYKSRGGAATADELVLWVDFGINQMITAGTFVYLVPASGAAAFIA